jgi:hypothetical protein
MQLRAGGQQCNGQEQGRRPTPKQGHGMGDGLFFERLHQEVYCGDCAEMSRLIKGQNLEKIAFFFCTLTDSYSATGVQLNPRGNRKGTPPSVWLTPAVPGLPYIPWEREMPGTLELKMPRDSPALSSASDEERDTGHKQSIKLVTHTQPPPPPVQRPTRVGAVPEATHRKWNRFSASFCRKIQHTRMCRATVCGAVCTGYAKALRGGEGTDTGKCAHSASAAAACRSSGPCLIKAACV